HAVNNLVAGAPDNMPAWDRVARTKDAPLGPVHQRQELDLLAVKKVKDVFAGVFAIEFRPPSRPIIIRLIVGHTLPVAPRQLRRIFDPEAALVWCVNHVHATEGLFGQPAKILVLVFINQQDAPARTEQFVCRNYAGKSATGDDNLGFKIHVVSAWYFLIAQ